MAKKILTQVHELMRTKHYSLKTEKSLSYYKMMRTLSVVIILVLLNCCRRANVYHNKAEISFDPSSGSMTVNAQIVIDNVHEFLLTENAKIASLTIDDKQTTIDHTEDRLAFPFINKASTIRLEYSLPIEAYNMKDVSLFTRGLRWFPFVYDRISSWDITVSVPENFQVFAYGNKGLQSHESGIRMYRIVNEVNTSYAFIVAPANCFDHIQEIYAEKVIDFYFLNKNTPKQDYIISESCNAFEFCSQELGEYARNDLIVIEVPELRYCQSLEGFLIIGGWFVDHVLNPKMKFWPSHEMIHQWIGSGVRITVKENNELRWFIEESLTEYLRMCMIEKSAGTDSLHAVLRSLVDEYEDTVKGTKEDVSIYENTPGRVTYLVGPLFFDYIRRKLGDHQWQAFIREIYSCHIDDIITYKDFRDVLGTYLQNEEVTEIEKLLKTKGIPYTLE
jgi:hypothetical protein